MRPGDAADPERYVRGWERLPSGVDRKAPLRRFYPADAILSLGDGVRAFRRWGFQQGQAALAGAVREAQPLSRAVADTVAGRSTPAQAARQADRAVERVKSVTE